MSETNVKGPWVCEHLFAEHSSPYDMRCVRCGVSSLAAADSDERMLMVWREWAKQTAQDGAAALFDRILFRVRHPERYVRAASSVPASQTDSEVTR